MTTTTPTLSAAFERLLQQLNELGGNAEIFTRALCQSREDQRERLHECGVALYEMTQCRAVEKFELYALEMAREVLRRDLDIALKVSSKKIALRDLGAAVRDPNQLADVLSAHVTDELSRSGLVEINAFFRDIVGIPIISEGSLWWVGLNAVRRNVIVHQHGVFDERAAQKLRDLKFPNDVIESFKTASQQPQRFSDWSEQLTLGVLVMSILANASSADRALCSRYGIATTLSEERFAELVSQPTLFHDADDHRDDSSSTVREKA